MPRQRPVRGSVCQARGRGCLTSNPGSLAVCRRRGLRVLTWEMVVVAPAHRAVVRMTLFNSRMAWKGPWHTVWLPGLMLMFLSRSLPFCLRFSDISLHVTHSTRQEVFPTRSATVGHLSCPRVGPSACTQLDAQCHMPFEAVPSSREVCYISGIISSPFSLFYLFMITVRGWFLDFCSFLPVSYFALKKNWSERVPHLYFPPDLFSFICFN